MAPHFRRWYPTIKNNLSQVLGGGRKKSRHALMRITFVFQHTKEFHATKHAADLHTVSITFSSSAQNVRVRALKKKHDKATEVETKKRHDERRPVHE
jgi:hypothetical protein